MAYSGFLLKIGDYTFPQKYIRADTYQAYTNMQDVDPWTDADGYLHRTAVLLKALKVEFETVPMLTDSEFSGIMANIRKNLLSEVDKTCILTAYIPELNGYVTQKGYMADFTPQIYGTYGGVIHYNQIRLAFIGGVA